MTSIINSNRSEFFCAVISSAFVGTGGTLWLSVQQFISTVTSSDLLWRREGAGGKSLCPVQVEPARAKFTLYDAFASTAPVTMGNQRLQVPPWGVLQHKNGAAGCLPCNSLIFYLLQQNKFLCKIK